MNWNAVGALVGVLALLVAMVAFALVGELFSALVSLGFATLVLGIMAVGDVLARRE